jgi:diguanylate cyclase (GGDEF)-like protein
MYLDVPTLIFAGGFVSFIGAIVLISAWLNMARPPALLWWAGSQFLFAAGVGCVGWGVAGKVPFGVIAGGSVINISTALLWAGARTFQKETVLPLWLVGGMLTWAVASALLVEGNGGNIMTVSGFVIAFGLLVASIYTLWRGRAEALSARWGLMAVMGLHVCILAGGAYDTLTTNASLLAGPQLGSWFGMIHFEGLIFSVGAPVLMITMCRERITQNYERASQIDPLTRIANRRALFSGAERLLDHCRNTQMPLSVIEFDLDRFKSINDVHGHAVGDAVLQTFVSAARGVLRQSDFFGRHGGEEFAVVLPGTNIEAAYVIAERIRHAFAEAGQVVGDRSVFATVSAGVAAMTGSDNFGDMLDNADRALYRAKGRGRNRVERTEGDQSATDGIIVRIA